MSAYCPLRSSMFWAALVLGLGPIVNAREYQAAAQCALPNTTTTRYVECLGLPFMGGGINCADPGLGTGDDDDEWVSIRVAAQCVANNTRVVVKSGVCAEADIEIKSTDVSFVVEEDGTVEIEPATMGDAFKIEPPATRVLIEGFDLKPDGANRFNEGVVIGGSSGTVTDVTISDVDIDGATGEAAFAVVGNGTDICFTGTLAKGAGTSPKDANGYRVDKSASVSGLIFDGVEANDNTWDGFVFELPGRIAHRPY